jgi:hypothetical protein
MLQYNKNGSTLPIIGLFIMAFLVTLLGAGFGVYSVMNNVYFSLMGTQFPAVLLAAVVTFLGVRYVVATFKLRRKIQGKEFSWSNFKKTAKERRG